MRLEVLPNPPPLRVGASCQPLAGDTPARFCQGYAIRHSGANPPLHPTGGAPRSPLGLPPHSMRLETNRPQAPVIQLGLSARGVLPSLPLDFDVFRAPCLFCGAPHFISLPRGRRGRRAASSGAGAPVPRVAPDGRSPPCGGRIAPCGARPSLRSGRTCVTRSRGSFIYNRRCGAVALALDDI